MSIKKNKFLLLIVCGILFLQTGFLIWQNTKQAEAQTICVPNSFCEWKTGVTNTLTFNDILDAGATGFCYFLDSGGNMRPGYLATSIGGANAPIMCAYYLGNTQSGDVFSYYACK